MRTAKTVVMIAIGSLLWAAACRNVESPVAIKSDVRTASAQQVIEHVKNVPIDAVFSNPCCNDDVHVIGIAHILITANVIHITVSDIAGVGVDSGSTYDGRGASVETNIFYSNQYEGTLSFGLNLTNENGCGFRMKLLLHTTVNANGDVTAQVENVQVSCGG